MVRVCGLRIDLVREDFFVVGLGDGQVEASEQLGQGLTFSAHQHRQGAFSVVGYSGTSPDGTNHRL
jgi:hypothetical protein